MTGQTYCIFSSQYLPHMGGVEVFTSNLARALAATGDRVITVTCTAGEAMGFHSEGEHIEVCRLPGISLLNGRLPWPRKNAAYRRLFVELSERTIDGVLINTRFYPLSLDGARFAREQGHTPVVLDHGSAPLTMGNPLLTKVVRKWERSITRRLKRYTPDFYGISTMSSQWLGQLSITSKGEIPNAIDAEAFRVGASSRSFREELGIPDSVVLVSFVGRLVREKGIDLFLEAANALEGESFAFVIAGEGPLQDTIAEVALENTFYCGRLSRADTAALLLESDLLLLPTRSEGFCTTLLEAGATSTVPVVTAVGGAREVLGEYYSFPCLLSSATKDTIVESLRYLQTHVEERESLARTICQHVEAALSWEATVDSLLQAFKRADDGGRPA